MFEERHIKVYSRRVVQIIAPGVPESKPAWRGKSSRIEKQGPYVSSPWGDIGLSGTYLADHIGIRTNAETVANSRVIGGACPIRTSYVDYAKRSSRLIGGDPAELTVSKHLFPERR